MPQISLYIDKDTLQKLEKAAQAEELSISKWVEKQLIKTLTTKYPADFENLFSSIADESFTVPKRYK